MRDDFSENPEDGGWTHDMLNHTKFRLNDVVEIITKFGMVLVGLIVCNKHDIIRIADPCRVFFTPIQDPTTNKVKYTISLLPLRVIGDDNFAQFKIDDISNISTVTSLEYVKLWDNNVEEFAKLWNKFSEN